MKRIRNFAIIAHIDHGKSTLADRFMERTGLLKEGAKQYLDRMDLEREKGITIKAQTVRMPYKALDGKEYVLNLIDTPGHVDFSYEVSRSLAACEGAVLLVDAAQGVEAQTVANAYLAIEQDLEIIPVINKVDLQAARPDVVRTEIEEMTGLDTADAIFVSAKNGTGIEDVLESIVRKCPPPSGDISGPFSALIFDSWYDPYQGVFVLFRIMQGMVRQGMRIRFMATGAEHEVLNLGVFSPDAIYVDELGAGDVGFLSASIRNIKDVLVGDTITDARMPVSKPIPGFKRIKPMVFAGLYPADNVQYEELRDALGKLALNDASLFYEPESSAALGFGFRCGFLGLLHMEIVQERLEREFDLNLIVTAPTVVYRIVRTDGKVEEIQNPSEMPEPQFIDHIEEPYIRTSIHTPSEYVGPILSLCTERRGVQREIQYFAGERVIMVLDMPLNEVVLDFFSRLKAVSRGYASMDYEPIGYRESKLVRLSILVNREPVDALSSIVHRDMAYKRGKDLVSRIKKAIPRQLFEVDVQAAIGSRVIARETVKPLRKNVTAKCYGGDITRKRKLLEKQKEGKKRMKRLGRVELPQEAFLAILKVEG
ncbi:MAG: elongation factor 4 [Deltaproteobacteria bacterium]|nr:MAG: elongation factor 4 [Deltaproteobacteria bacterium]